MTEPSFSLSTVLPVSKPKPRRWPWITAGIVVVLLLAGGAAYLFWPTARSTTTAASGPTALRSAYTSCGSTGQISDSDRTLLLDMTGSQSGSGDLNEKQVACVLNGINTPQYVFDHMAATRALDGRQSDSWGDFTASWSYHPDQGLDVIVRQVKG